MFPVHCLPMAHGQSETSFGECASWQHYEDTLQRNKQKRTNYKSSNLASQAAYIPIFRRIVGVATINLGERKFNPTGWFISTEQRDMKMTQSERMNNISHQSSIIERNVPKSRQMTSFETIARRQSEHVTGATRAFGVYS